MAGQRQPALAQRPADHLVDGVVPADVLAHAEQLAVGGEQPGGVQPAGALEGRLGRPQPVRQHGQQLAGTRSGSSAHSNRVRVRTASMLALPHTPHELVV